VESTQATAGTWATSPSKVQLIGPGVKRPGDTVQEITNLAGSASTSSGTFVALSGVNATLSVQSAANLVAVKASGQTNSTISGGSSHSVGSRLSRGTTNNTNLFGNSSSFVLGGTSWTSDGFPFECFGYDLPNAVGGITYSLQGNQSATSTSWPSTQINAREIQI